MAGRIPFPSLPIIKIPFPDKVFSYKFSPPRKVPYKGMAWADWACKNVSRSV